MLMADCDLTRRYISLNFCLNSPQIRQNISDLLLNLLVYC